MPTHGDTYVDPCVAILQVILNFAFKDIFTICVSVAQLMAKNRNSLRSNSRFVQYKDYLEEGNEIEAEFAKNFTVSNSAYNLSVFVLL